MMKVTDGWRFSSADFSIIAGGGNTKGHVMLVRDPEGKKLWFKITKDMDEDDYPELYAYGRGMTLDEAFANANKDALEIGLLS